MSALDEFLLARLEEEAVARAAARTDQQWISVQSLDGDGSARVWSAGCGASRGRLLGVLQLTAAGDAERHRWTDMVAGQGLRTLAMTYADHPGFQRAGRV